MEITLRVKTRWHAKIIAASYAEPTSLAVFETWDAAGVFNSRNPPPDFFHHKRPGHPSQTSNRQSATMEIDL